MQPIEPAQFVRRFYETTLDIANCANEQLGTKIEEYLYSKTSEDMTEDYAKSENLEKEIRNLIKFETDTAVSGIITSQKPFTSIKQRIKEQLRERFNQLVLIIPTLDYTDLEIVHHALNWLFTHADITVDVMKDNAEEVRRVFMRDVFSK